MNLIRTWICCVVIILCASYTSYASPTRGRFPKIKKPRVTTSKISSKTGVEIGGASIGTRGIARLDEGIAQVQHAALFENLNTNDEVFHHILTQLQRLRARIPSSPNDILYLDNIFQVVGSKFNLSGTLFKVDGQIFGAVATHSFSQSPGEFPTLSKKVVLGVYVNGKMRTLRGKPVLANPMLDVTLLAFDAKTKEILTKGFDLETRVPEIGNTLSSHGFILKQDAVEVPRRTVLGEDSFSFRTSFAWPPRCRAGLCGSAVVDLAGKLVGIHVGSNTPLDKEQPLSSMEPYNVGYVVPSSYLEKMARSFLTGNQTTYPLIWRGKKIADLEMDEFVEEVNFYDVQGNVIWKEKTSMNFSYTRLESIEQQLLPFKIEFEIRRMYWPNDGAKTMKFETRPIPAVYYNF